MQDGPAIPAAMLQRQNGFVYDLCELFRFVQRHHPFVVWLSLPVGALFLFCQIFLRQFCFHVFADNAQRSAIVAGLEDAAAHLSGLLRLPVPFEQVGGFAENAENIFVHTR